jgi:hypothetical protein
MVLVVPGDRPNEGGDLDQLAVFATGEQLIERDLPRRRQH